MNSREHEYRESVAHAERCLLGTLNLDNDRYAIAARRLSADDFSLDTHRRIFAAQGRLAESGTPWNFVVLSTEMTKTNELASIGGMSTLANLDVGLPRASVKALDGYIRIIEESAWLRRSRAIFATAAEQTADGNADPAAMIEIVKGKLAELEAKRPKTISAPMFQDALEFVAEKPTAVDWLVEGVIPRSGNGIMGGDPKASKSFAALDLALSASCGVPWMGFRIPQKLRVALVSREDDPELTRRRMNRLLAGRREYAAFSTDYMRLNTRAHLADFQVTNEANMSKLINELRQYEADLCILDVFRTLHSADENDNTEVAKVLAKVTRIQTELKCACLLIHHIAKTENPSPFKGLRGASCIHGWMEFGMAVSVTNPEEPDRSEYIRRMQFECKEATTRDIHYRITNSPDGATVKLEQLWPDQTTRPRQRVSVLAAGRDGKHMASGSQT